MARAKVNYTKRDGFEAVARSLREFGYPDATAQMVAETYTAMKRGDPLPHGIVGMFAEGQIKEVWEKFDTLPDGDA
jgi:hypothetical protein